MSELNCAAVLINGKVDATIPVADRGFQYGDGVFETIRIVNRQPVLWALHKQRLTAGCEFLKIPLELRLLEQELHGLLMANGACGIVKIIISRGQGGRGYAPPARAESLRALQFFPLPEDLQRPNENGVAVITCNHRISRNGQLVRLKHLCRIDQVIASAELPPQYAEGIMLTEDDEVIEGTRSNIFVVQGAQLVTPCLTTAGIQGVMREYLLDRFASDGVSVAQTRIYLPELLAADGVFICNSVFGVLPVVKLAHGKNVKQFQVNRFAKTAWQYSNEVFAANS